MAVLDGRDIPIRAAAFRLTVPILDADGDLVTGAASLDSEVSKDGGTFADCTNEATEIATSSGMYYLDLTATEMDAATVAVIVKTGTAGAKTTPITLYPAAMHAGASVAGSTTTTLKLATTASAVDDAYNGRVVTMVSGAIRGTSRVIDDYNGTTKAITVVAWVGATPTTGDQYVIQ